jgi:hypothetical protein
VRVVVRSRLGRGVLTVLGILYFASAATVLIYYVATNWGANGLTDYVLQLGLVSAALGGVVLFLIGTEGLSLWRARPDGRAASNTHKTAAA